jgi:hypothetical protein
MRCWIVALLGFLITIPARSDEPRLGDQYGFLPPEIYKLEDRIAGLIVRDLDGDGIGDITVIDNARSRIDLLLSTGGAGAGAAPEAARTEANVVTEDRRMRLASLPVNREVISLRASDLDGDGTPDLVFYGNPAELVVLPNRGKGEFGEARRIAIGEAIASPHALDLGDLDGDGRLDLALLTPEDIYLVHQREGGKLSEPERLPHSANSPLMLRLVDLNGDARLDLAVLEAGNDDPLHVRFGMADGQLGPEERLALEAPRAVAFAQLDERPGQEVLTIESRSGRVRLYGLQSGPEMLDSHEGRKNRVQSFPLPRGGARERSLAMGDLDGDGKTDAVVTDPTRSQVLVYLQGPDGLGTPRAFPSLAGLKAIRAGDLDGDGSAEVVVLSDTEKQLAAVSMKDGRLAFPSPLPTTGGDPVALEVADLDGDRRPEILYTVPAGRADGGQVFALRALGRGGGGAFVPFRWGDDDAVPVRGLNGAPPALKVVDANGDDRADILVFNEYGTPVLLLGRADGPPTPSTAGPGPLANADAARVGRPLKGQTGLLVAQGGFARQVEIDPEGRWAVRDQFNAGRGDAQVVAAAALNGPDDGTASEIALWDKGEKVLRFLERADGTFRPAGTVPIGTLDVRGMFVVDLDGDRREDLLLAGPDRFIVVLSGRIGPKLKLLTGYETTRKDAHLSDLTAGDLDGDGRPDLALGDTGEHFIEIAAFRSREPAELIRALAFQIYERKALRDPDRNVEPRDLAIGDVDGDHRDDLVLIVHDRVLIYRQDPGPEAAKTADAK